jgi:biopolymer transport protein ExbD
LDNTSDRLSIVVNVLPDGSWMVGGATVQQAGLDKALRSRLMASEEPLQLRIRTDQDVTYDRIEPILTSAAVLGIGDIVFSVFEERNQ